MKRALEVLELAEGQVEQMPKGAAEKLVLAWWLRRRTTVTLRWVGERLGMGHYSRVTQAVRRMEGHPRRKLNQIRRKLERLTSANS